MKLISIDLLRGVAAFMIVGCHLVLSPRTDAASFIAHFCNFAVGLFAALSGFLMSTKRDLDWFGYVRKRASRLLPIYLIWTVVFILFAMGFQFSLSGSISGRFFKPSFYLSALFTGGASCHLWFVISLFYAQAIVYCLLKSVYRFHGLNGLWCCFFGFTVVCLAAWMKNWFGTYPIRLLGFLLMGIGARQLYERKVVSAKWLVVGVVVAGIVHIVAQPILHGFIRDALLVIPVLLAFVSIPNQAISNPKIKQFIELLGITSMGVYLMHPLFCAGFGVAIRKLFPTPFGLAPILIDWFACYFAALICSIILTRIKVLRRFIV